MVRAESLLFSGRAHTYCVKPRVDFSPVNSIHWCDDRWHLLSPGEFLSNLIRCTWASFVSITWRRHMRGARRAFKAAIIAPRGVRLCTQERGQSGAHIYRSKWAKKLAWRWGGSACMQHWFGAKRERAVGMFKKRILKKVYFLCGRPKDNIVVPGKLSAAIFL